MNEASNKSYPYALFAPLHSWLAECYEIQKNFQEAQ